MRKKRKREKEREEKGKIREGERRGGKERKKGNKINKLYIYIYILFFLY